MADAYACPDPDREFGVNVDGDPVTDVGAESDL